jgi:hypothetical protein
MRNYLPVRAWLTFDLKGATANRRALAAHALHRIHQHARGPSGAGASAAYGTLRDWEWLDVAMSVDVSDEDKARLSDTVTADAAFLRSQGVLDYSLLVGIHRVDGSPSLAEREARLTSLLAHGGYASTDRQRVYFFGIIDVLERHSLRWKLQRAALTAGYHLLLRPRDADGISALPPAEYADRFCTFVHSEVLHAPYEGLPSPTGAPPLTPPGTPAPLLAHAPDFAPGAPPKTEPTARLLAGASTARRGHVRFGSCDCCARCCCGGSPEPATGEAEPARGLERWGHLWQRRRRGLVQERIDGERADHLRRISELEASLQRARDEAAGGAAVDEEDGSSGIVAGASSENQGGAAGGGQGDLEGGREEAGVSSAS